MLKYKISENVLYYPPCWGKSVPYFTD